MSGLLRLLLGLGLAALSGGLLVLAYPPYNLWPLAWVALLPMLLAQFWLMPARLSSLASATTMGLWGLGYFGPVFGGSGLYMEWLPLAIFLIALLGDMGVRAFHERTGYRYFVWQGVSNWVGIEMIRGFVPIAATWGFIAYTQHTQPWLIQPVSVFSIYGLSALIVLVNFVLGQGLLGLLCKEAPLSPRLVRRWLWAGGLVLLGWVGLSLWLYRPESGSLRVAAIQPATSPILALNRGEAALAQATLERMKAQTLEAARQGARLIVWPEGAFTFDPQTDDRLGLVTLAQESRAYLVVGYVVVTGERIFRNEATVIGPEGRFLGVYGKDHPVVFAGETSPTRGTYPVYSTAIGRLATLICYDLDFTDTARKMARRGAQVVAVPSQDWATIADKHYTHLVFRAVENRLSMVKADGGFDSAIIDPWGRVLRLANYPQGSEATLVADVPLGRADAPAVRLGDWVGWLGLLGLVGFTVADPLSRRRKRLSP
ncbi:MAG: nitrilase-related carbon-nitrogen hydrolase [Meiothermus sp.]|uniref:apolipoprotein N-acyltransferase n=1 Tax=Meiothermus sp. TaxID=1955249 RepID=UPI00298EFA0A|nr:nitrilase-related carbon-nitrogen hydrolase [Meiothermus sp.]MDW8425392.1 nitrilase-related carbon-nitrogen hydrolase [Meiothermus sp.]